MSEGWFVALGLGVIATGVSYIAWGNWIPIAATVNNPTAAGVYAIVVGVLMAAFGVWCARSDRI